MNFYVWMAAIIGAYTCGALNGYKAGRMVEKYEGMRDRRTV